MRTLIRIRKCAVWDERTDIHCFSAVSLRSSLWRVPFRVRATRDWASLSVSFGRFRCAILLQESLSVTWVKIFQVTKLVTEFSSQSKKWDTLFLRIAYGRWFLILSLKNQMSKEQQEKKLEKLQQKKKIFFNIIYKKFWYYVRNYKQQQRHTYCHHL